MFLEFFLNKKSTNTVAGLGPPCEPESGRRGREGVSRGGRGCSDRVFRISFGKKLKNTVAGLTTYPSLRARVRKEREGRGQQWSAGRPATVFLD